MFRGSDLRQDPVLKAVARAQQRRARGGGDGARGVEKSSSRGDAAATATATATAATATTDHDTGNLGLDARLTAVGTVGGDIDGGGGGCGGNDTDDDDDDDDGDEDNSEVRYSHSRLVALDLSLSRFGKRLDVLRRCRLPALECLDLAETDVWPDEYLTLGQFPSLRALSIAQTAIRRIDPKRERSETTADSERDGGDDATTEVHNHASARSRACDEMRLPHLPALVYLDLYHPQSGGRPRYSGDELARLYPQLRYLHACDLEWTVLERLTSLETLDLSRHRTEALPTEALRTLVRRLPHLTALVVPTRPAMWHIQPMSGARRRYGDTRSRMRAEAGLESDGRRSSPTGGGGAGLPNATTLLVTRVVAHHDSEDSARRRERAAAAVEMAFRGGDVETEGGGSGGGGGGGGGGGDGGGGGGGKTRDAMSVGAGGNDRRDTQTSLEAHAAETGALRPSTRPNFVS
jgi:hypothetical protein